MACTFRTAQGPILQVLYLVRYGRVGGYQRNVHLQKRKKITCLTSPPTPPQKKRKGDVLDLPLHTYKNEKHQTRRMMSGSSEMAWQLQPGRTSLCTAQARASTCIHYVPARFCVRTLPTILFEGPVFERIGYGS